MHTAQYMTEKVQFTLEKKFMFLRGRLMTPQSRQTGSITAGLFTVCYTFHWFNLLKQHSTFQCTAAVFFKHILVDYKNKIRTCKQKKPKKNC